MSVVHYTLLEQTGLKDRTLLKQTGLKVTGTAPSPPPPPGAPSLIFSLPGNSMYVPLVLRNL